MASRRPRNTADRSGRKLWRSLKRDSKTISQTLNILQSSVQSITGTRKEDRPTVDPPRQRGLPELMAQTKQTLIKTGRRPMEIWRSCRNPQGGGKLAVYIILITPSPPNSETWKWKLHDVGMLFFEKDREAGQCVCVCVKMDVTKYSKKTCWRLQKIYVSKVLGNLLPNQTMTYTKMYNNGK
ncbi:hypothetical protein XENOCAPTIV_011961 [Xenoophorus captivus]|uniref:Uncharacterized protein n=1 Tax=Xenoophorus captivus TaxID=1517983 RepID=A0ABV0RJ05_9TELE